MPASYEQGFNALAKKSTRYLATGAGVTTCNTDLSQRAVNMTAGASFLFEASPASLRFDFSHPRTMIFRITANNADTGSLFRHGAASPTRFAFPAANQIRATVNNATAGTLALTGLDAVRDTLVVAWTSMANPDTTGASDAVLSWLHAWNVTNGTYEQLRFTHAANTTKTQTVYMGAQDNTPTLVFSGTITGIVFENRFMSPTEIAADWVTTFTPPTSVLELDGQGIPPQSGTIDAQNYHQGPAHVWATDATRRMQRRTLSTLVNDRFIIRPTWTAAALAGPFVRQVDGVYRMLLGTLRCVPVPDSCNVLWVRIHSQNRTTSGAAVPTGLRVYSMNRPPGALGLGLGGGAEAFEQYYVGTIVTRDEDISATNGTWDTLGLLTIARGRSGIRKGMTYIAAAIAIDPLSASANDANALSILNAIHVVPGFYQPDGGAAGGFSP